MTATGRVGHRANGWNSYVPYMCMCVWYRLGDEIYRRKVRDGINSNLFLDGSFHVDFSRLVFVTTIIIFCTPILRFVVLYLNLNNNSLRLLPSCTGHGIPQYMHGILKSENLDRFLSSWKSFLDFSSIHEKWLQLSGIPSPIQHPWQFIWYIHYWHIDKPLKKNKLPRTLRENGIFNFFSVSSW